MAFGWMALLGGVAALVMYWAGKRSGGWIETDPRKPVPSSRFSPEQQLANRRKFATAVLILGSVGVGSGVLQLLIS